MVIMHHHVVLSGQCNYTVLTIELFFHLSRHTHNKRTKLMSTGTGSISDKCQPCYSVTYTKETDSEDPVVTLHTESIGNFYQFCVHLI